MIKGGVVNDITSIFDNYFATGLSDRFDDYKEACNESLSTAGMIISHEFRKRDRAGKDNNLDDKNDFTAAVNY